jgi:uncharacterized protein YjbI with pentapeptide repeats
VIDEKFEDFEEAILDGANFERANFEGTDFKKADLRGAYNLSFDQLSKVKTLYDAKLDKEILIELKKEYPILFEKPNIL